MDKQNQLSAEVALCEDAAAFELPPEFAVNAENAEPRSDDTAAAAAADRYKASSDQWA